MKLTLGDLAQLTHCELVGEPSLTITGVADLDSATPNDASFLANPRYEGAMKHSKAGVVFVDKKAPRIEGKNFLISDNPSRAFQQVIQAFHASAYEKTGFQGIHPTALLHPTVTLGENVSIGPYAVIDKGAKIGNRTTIGAAVSIGVGSVIGDDCLLHPHVVIREQCVLGNRVILQPGVIIGACGFGYLTDAKGEHTKLDQVGNVVIEDDVEIGANSTIDRARFKATRIGRGSKIDNLVQIGHGVEVGPYNIIVAQTGIAGSSKTGRNVVMGGQTAVVGHLSIADGVMLAGRSGVVKTISQPGGKYGGAPVVPLLDFHRQLIHMRNLDKYAQKIEELEKRLLALEDGKRKTEE